MVFTHDKAALSLLCFSALTLASPAQHRRQDASTLATVAATATAAASATVAAAPAAPTTIEVTVAPDSMPSVECGTAYYTNIDVYTGLTSGCYYMQNRNSAGAASAWPQALQAGFTFNFGSVPGPYLLFPLTNNAPYAMGDAGTDRAVFNSQCEFAGALKQSATGFTQCTVMEAGEGAATTAAATTAAPTTTANPLNDFSSYIGSLFASATGTATARPAGATATNGLEGLIGLLGAGALAGAFGGAAQTTSASPWAGWGESQDDSPWGGSSSWGGGDSRGGGGGRGGGW